jgi:hypothetical protein
MLPRDCIAALFPDRWREYLRCRMRELSHEPNGCLREP